VNLLLVYTGIFLSIVALMLVYFRLARRFHILDKPNERSSHSQLTLRGGGIIFTMACFLYFAVFGGQYPWFMAGLALIAVISFADDVRHQPALVRFLVHIIGVGLLFLQAGYYSFSYIWIIPAFVLSLGLLNAWNFMDGINGITVGYAAVNLASLYILNERLAFVDEHYLHCLGLSMLVFGWFNFRKRAICFAGDVGSIGVSFALQLPMALLLQKTLDPVYLVMQMVYIADTSLTLVHRILKRERIFEAHRQHLFQMMANEGNWGHLRVSMLYMSTQAVCTFLSLRAVHSYGANSYGVLITAFIVLAVLHCLLKFGVFKINLFPSKS
jgi:UDP-N-acetylmuramyl pentapeptide phosphotransferase/UDP-N-acetylglucosamine-1-phosphate transferase